MLGFMKADMKGLGVTEEATSEEFSVLLKSTELDTVTSTTSSSCGCPTACGQKKKYTIYFSLVCPKLIKW